MPDTLAGLPVVLRRLYVRLRARGVDPEPAREQAAELGAELLGCEVATARAVLAGLDLTGPRRPV